jgi:hypothetical protein
LRPLRKRGIEKRGLKDLSRVCGEKKIIKKVWIVGMVVCIFALPKNEKINSLDIASTKVGYI